VWRILKKTFYLQFCMETPEGHQKSIFNTSKVKKTKIHMGSIQQSLQAQPKILKKLSEHQIRTKIFPKKVCLVTLKRKGAKNFYGGYPTEFAGWT
jgi:hypothetical protein